MVGIMILPSSHSPSVQSVAGNGDGSVRTTEGLTPVERNSKPPLDVSEYKNRKTENNKMKALQKTEIYTTMLKDYPDVLSFEQMCRALSVSPKTGYKLLQDEKLIGIKIGRAYRIPKIHMIAYLMNGNQKSETA
jgi:excisionase family DNA binding protein